MIRRVLPLAVFSIWAICVHAETFRVEIPSSLDGTPQSIHLFPSPSETPRPLLVVLHHWSTGIDKFDGSEWEAEAQHADWHLLLPDFRGPNNRPEACASMLARQDILDAVAFAIDNYPVDESRIYLAGVSGGGHMAMVMAGHAPERWTAVSAWAGISDLTAWHAETKAAGLKYFRDIEAVVGGSPGTSQSVDSELRMRSPIHHLAHAKDLPIDIATGIHDGHSGSVPIHHTIDAFNVIAKARGDATVDGETIVRLSAANYSESPQFQDESYNRGIHLRRETGPSRMTIFEGGHEGIPEAAVAWLALH